MKKILFLALIAMISFTACKSDKNADGSGDTANSTQKSTLENASYALGLNYANKLKEDAIPVEFPRLNKAMKDVLTKAEPEMPDAEVQHLMQAYFTDTIENPPTDKFSYALGFSIAKSLSQMGFDKLSLDEFQLGQTDFNDQKTLRFELTAVDSIIGVYQQEQMDVIKAERGATADAAKTEGIAFLAENGKKEGVITTASGLQYKVLKKGTGKSPVATDKVTVHYVGKLINGTTFDSSVDRGQPATFPLNGVIKGWTEGVQLMKEGAKFQFYIPSELAYGETGAQTIPGNATLIFDVELIKVVK